MHTTQALLDYGIREIFYRMHFRNAAVRRRFGPEAERYIAKFTDIGSFSTEVVATSTLFNIEAINGKVIRSIVNLKRMNDIENINDFLAGVNRKLPYTGLYIGCVETINQRKRRIQKKFSKAIAYPYYVCDFILKRVFPKWGPTRKIYRLLTRGNNRTMSLTETLGRLRVCGFDIEDYAEAGKLTYIVARKIARPIITKEPFYGVLIRLRRVGEGGKLFNVYKFRTMHPYAEFLQDYIYETNGLSNGDKIVNDFRVTSWGRLMRKLWIDEQPMWINWIKGDLKIIGVRPLSNQKLSLYPADFRMRRMNYRPGLIPPFYADLPQSFPELVESERKYFDSYDKHPWITDMRYFFLAVYNILVRGARSG
jgi:lipopolysaccharide/colanic/teichoic acid biosynthesis glycosyltransferase